MSDRHAPLGAWHHEPVALPLPRVAHVVQAVDRARTAAIGFDGAPWITDGPLGAVVYDLAPHDERRLLREAPRRVFQIRFAPASGELVIRLLRRDICLDTFVAIGPGAPRLTERERARLRERIAARFGIARGFFALPDELDEKSSAPGGSPRGSAARAASSPCPTSSTSSSSPGGSPRGAAARAGSSPRPMSRSRNQAPQVRAGGLAPAVFLPRSTGAA